MSQPGDTLDRAFSLLCMAVIKSAKRDLTGRDDADRRSAECFFYDDDSLYPLYLEFLMIEFQGVRTSCILGHDEGDE